MSFTSRETWTVIHGMVLGALFLVAFTGGLAGLYSLRPGYLTAQGIQERMRRLYVGGWVMAASAMLTVVTGTWIVYPWYRKNLATIGSDKYAACTGQAVPSSNCSARDFLYSNASGNTKGWHTFGMEWKEHVAWFSPILAIAAAYLIWYYGPRLISRPWLRAAVITMFVGAFGAAVVAGILGAFITKVAPIR